MGAFKPLRLRHLPYILLTENTEEEFKSTPFVIGKAKGKEVYLYFSPVLRQQYRGETEEHSPRGEGLKETKSLYMGAFKPLRLRHLPYILLRNTQGRSLKQKSATG